MIGWTNVSAGISIMSIGTIISIALVVYAWRKYNRLVQEGASDTATTQLITECLKQHYDDLVDMARKAALEMPLPLNSACCDTYAIDQRTGKEVKGVLFANTYTTWPSNDRGQIELPMEHDSPMTWNGLMSHLDSGSRGFKKKFEDWRMYCTWYVGWNIGDDESRFPYRIEGELRRLTDEITKEFKRVARRRTFKGTCEICKDM